MLDRKVGRETRFRLNAEPLKEVQDWVAFYSKYWTTNMLRLSQLCWINNRVEPCLTRININRLHDCSRFILFCKVWQTLSISDQEGNQLPMLPPHIHLDISFRLKPCHAAH